MKNVRPALVLLGLIKQLNQGAHANNTQYHMPSRPKPDLVISFRSWRFLRHSCPVQKFRPKSPTDIGSELMDAAASQHFVASMDTGRITGDQLRQYSPGSHPHLNEGSEDFFLNDSMSELLHLSHSQRLDVPLSICLKQWFLSTKHEATFI